MASNLPPGVTDADIDRHWGDRGEREFDDEDRYRAQQEQDVWDEEQDYQVYLKEERSKREGEQPNSDS